MRGRSESFPLWLLAGGFALAFCFKTIFEGLFYTWVIKSLESHFGILEAEVMARFADIGFALIAAIGTILLMYRYIESNLRQEFAVELRIEPTFHLEPRGAEKGFRTVRIVIENISKSVLRNCRVREKMFVNRYGQSSGIQRYFRLAAETHADMATHTYKQSFDLQGEGDREIIDVAFLDETKSDSRVVMLYATTPTSQPMNAIIRDCFPHRLTISVASDNLPAPEERTYDLKITDDGILQIVPVRSA